jgi:hypothetical protein
MMNPLLEIAEVSGETFLLATWRISSTRTSINGFGLF